jgi:hypothetical protein
MTTINPSQLIQDGDIIAYCEIASAILSTVRKSKNAQLSNEQLKFLHNKHWVKHFYKANDIYKQELRAMFPILFLVPKDNFPLWVKS